ncbi:hypothetical protein GCM10010121_087510 [Streptomyces brasiliensis]|uniref:Uncharacterized protein n=1 Tax=Streptomyces brasiliensis TaxID=1954 RepID=A0A917P630_9ACTN|nr:hypothetical protein GCM10010121_087510 [Streptomyces brasiliensis]
MPYQVKQGPFQNALFTSREGGEPVGAWAFPGPVVGWPGKVTAQVAGLEMVGEGQAADVGVDGLPRPWANADWERNQVLREVRGAHGV